MSGPKILGLTATSILTQWGFMSNHAGGVLRGISSGQDIVTRIALKPTSSLTTPGKMVDVEGNETEVVTKGRHDPGVGIRATPIAEAMVALVLEAMVISDVQEYLFVTRLT